MAIDLTRQPEPARQGFSRLQPLIGRLFFAALSASVVVFFSEKAFWYPQGFVLGELIVFYGIAIYACLWAIAHFHVRRVSALVLVAALFAFLIEGVITPVIYEAGLLDPIMPAYFIGWHGLLSMFFGWYVLRKWLLGRQWMSLLISAGFFGLFWGLWSLTFWLPENIAEWAELAAQGETRSGNTLWTATEFGLYALVFTSVLMLSHWLLGRGWQTQFTLSKVEKGVLVIALLILFAALVYPVQPLAIFKLLLMFVILYIALRVNRGREQDGSLLRSLAGPVQFVDTLPLLAMPITATGVYALARLATPTEDLLRIILEGFPFLQVLSGGIVFLWAWVAVVRPRRQSERSVSEA